MELRQLRYFIAIVDSASMSKAAGKLFVAQPALSQQMRQLEEELQVVLLDRSSRGVTPTEAGGRLYLQAKDILALTGSLGDRVREGIEAPVGEVRFGMSGTVSELLSVPLIVAARQRFPGIRIRPVEAMSGYVLDWLRRGEVDLALVYATADPQGFLVQHVLTEELVLFGKRGSAACGAAPDSQLTLAEVLTLDLITPGLSQGVSHGLRGLIESAALSIAVPLLPTLEIDSYSQIKRLGALGAGYGILPEAAIAAEVAAELVDRWRIVEPALRRHIYLTQSTERPLSAAARAVAKLAVEVTRQLVGEGLWPAQLAPIPQQELPA